MTGRALHRVELEGELTIITAAEQHERLRSALDGGGGLMVDLSGVTDLDTAGLQLLLLARREADRQGTTVEFRGAGRAVTDVLAVAHLNEALEPWRPASPEPVPGAPEDTARPAAAAEDTARPAAAAGEA